MSSFQKQIEPYILRLVIEEDKMSFISCCTFLIVFLIHFFIVIEAVRNGHTDIVRFLKINGDDVNKEGRVRQKGKWYMLCRGWCVVMCCKSRKILKQILLFNIIFRKRKLIFKIIFTIEKLLQVQKIAQRCVKNFLTVNVNRTGTEKPSCMV